MTNVFQQFSARLATQQFSADHNLGSLTASPNINRLVRKNEVAKCNYTRSSLTQRKFKVTSMHTNEDDSQLKLPISSLASSTLARLVLCGSLLVSSPSSPAWASSSPPDTSAPSHGLTSRLAYEIASVPLTMKTSSNAIPSVLSADAQEDFDLQEGKTFYEGSNRMKADPNFSFQQKFVQWTQSKNFARNLVEYLLLAAVAFQIRAARNRTDPIAKKLGVWDQDSQQALVGTRWKVTVDVGRELGTWMPPSWAISGRRMEIPMAIELQEGGVCTPIGIGAYIKLNLGPGTWNVKGDVLRFNLQISGFERGDITLPEGLLYFKTRAWGNMISGSRGELLLKQRRAVVREEWRMVGKFTAEAAEEDGETYSMDANKMPLPAARMKQSDSMDITYTP